MPQHPGKDLREACATFTPAQWAHVTLKALEVTSDPGAARTLTRLMQTTAMGEDYSELIGDAQTPKERLQFAKLRTARLITYDAIVAYGAQRAKVNWRNVAEMVGEVKPARILGDGFGMKAMF